MIPDKNIYHDFVVFAHELADNAGSMILPYVRGTGAVDNKADQAYDPVTEADRAAEQTMRAMIEEKYPGHGIHGEVPGDARPNESPRPNSP